MPSLHPEADILTAFAESGLTGKERQRVMEHLATCSDCREIVFLAQPEMAKTQETFAPARARRFRWMAWASAAAIVVVVGSAVVLQHERVTNLESPAPIATTSSKVETKAPEADQQRDTALASSAVRVEHAPAQPSAPTRAGKEAKGKAPAETPFAITPKKDKSEIAGGELRAPKPALPTAAPVVQGQAVGGLIPQQNVTGPMQRNAQAAQQQPFQGPANSANANLTDAYAVDGNANAPKMAAPAVAKAKKEAAAAPVSGIVGGYARAPMPAAPARARMAPAQWRISESGQLERSSGGTTWTPVLEGGGRKFHVVSVVGDMVWAGGDKGALFVSRDGGRNWEPVNIQTSGDILSIQFADLMNGVLQTSDGETWKTSDGGKSWQKQ